MNHSKKENMQSWPFYDDDEIEAVVDVLRSGRVNQWGGTCVHRFQELLAAWLGVPHAIAVANGTLALELALRAFNIGPGDEVIVSCRSFIASASCVAIVGAKQVFADVNRDSGNIDVTTIAPLITEKTKAIIPVHIGGWPCDMPGIMELAKEHNLYVIEDCAQAIGAEIDGKPVGSFGDASAFSFCQDKIISTGGEGGALCLHNPEAWLKAWSYKDHGKDWQFSHQTDNTPWFKWIHSSLGSNFRMTEMQAAIGIIQLGKLEGWLAHRRVLAKLWQEGLSKSDVLRVPIVPGNYENAYYRLYAYLDKDAAGDNTTRENILMAFKSEGIVAFSGTCPEIYNEMAYAGEAHTTQNIAHELASTSVAFPIHPLQNKKITSEKISLAVDILNDFS